MNKLFCKTIQCLFFALGASLAVAGHAAEARPGVRETVIAGDYFGAGGDATLPGPIEGDAFIAGSQVDIDKMVNGDALIAGGSVAITEHVAGNVYAAGGSLTLDGLVAGNVRLAGSRIELTKRSQVSGKTTLAARHVAVLGRAGRQLVVFADRVTLDGEVAGNVTIAARSLSIGPNARVSGKLTYRGSLPAQVDPAAVLNGGINYLGFDFDDETYQPVARVIAWVSAIAFTVGLFLIGMIAILSAPELTAHVSLLGRRRPISSLALGIVTIACMPVVVILLMITIVGIPFAFMLLLAWPMILIFGYLAGVMAVSDAIAGPNAEAKGRRIFLLAMGLGVMLLFARVPLAGWIIGMLLLVMGVGAMMLNAMGASVPVRMRKEKRLVVVPTAESTVRQEPTFRID
ncbi:MAG TPA: polymer-forming cytoskeletal protein [Burkholderiales bacterium]|nr:polymer-forming cytoskeletal protein [Burkholderiales bacterium]